MRNKTNLIWLFPAIVFAIGLIPNITDTLLFKSLGVIIFLGAIAVVIYCWHDLNRELKESALNVHIDDDAIEIEKHALSRRVGTNEKQAHC